MAVSIAMLMEQAQVYASAWSLVDGPFDQGGQLQLANDEKARLEDMLELFQDEVDANAAPGNLKETAEGLVQWHKNRLTNIEQLLSAAEGTQLCLGVDDANPVVLEGELLKGWRIALQLAHQQFEKFPVSIDRTASDSDEEE